MRPVVVAHHNAHKWIYTNTFEATATHASAEYANDPVENVNLSRISSPHQSDCRTVHTHAHASTVHCYSGAPEIDGAARDQTDFKVNCQLSEKPVIAIGGSATVRISAGFFDCRVSADRCPGTFRFHFGWSLWIAPFTHTHTRGRVERAHTKQKGLVSSRNWSFVPRRSHTNRLRGTRCVRIYVGVCGHLHGSFSSLPRYPSAWTGRRVHFYNSITAPNQNHVSGQISIVAAWSTDVVAVAAAAATKHTN